MELLAVLGSVSIHVQTVTFGYLCTALKKTYEEMPCLWVFCMMIEWIRTFTNCKSLIENCYFKEGSAFVPGAIPLYILSRRLLAYAHSFKANSWSRVVDAFVLEVIVSHKSEYKTFSSLC